MTPILEQHIPLGPWIWVFFGFVFQAGMIYAAFRAMAKDVNGIGTKVRTIETTNEKRGMIVIVLLLLEGIPEDKRAHFEAKVKMMMDV